MQPRRIGGVAARRRGLGERRDAEAAGVPGSKVLGQREPTKGPSAPASISPRLERSRAVMRASSEGAGARSPARSADRRIPRASGWRSGIPGVSGAIVMSTTVV